MPELSRRRLLGAAATDAVCHVPATRHLAHTGHHVP